MNTGNLFSEIWDNPKLTDTEKVLMIGLLLKGEVLPADDVITQLPHMLSMEQNRLLISSLLAKYQTNQQPKTPETSESTEVKPPSETENTVSEEHSDQQPATVESPSKEQDSDPASDTQKDVSTPESPVSDETQTEIPPVQPIAAAENEPPKPRRGRPKGSKNKPKTASSPLPAPAPVEKAPAEPLQNDAEPPIGDPPTDVPAMSVSEMPKRRMGRPKGSKNKPKRIINGLDNPTDEELIEKFKIGNPLEYDTLWTYCTGNKKYHYIRTNYQMEGANCIGIFVPYLPIFEAQKNCKEFILGIRKIEYPTSGTTQLRVMAQREHKPYLQNEWDTLDKDQVASMQPLKEPLNHLLKKLGGDTIGNDKLSAVAKPSFFSNNPTTRYTCSIKNV